MVAAAIIAPFSVSISSSSFLTRRSLKRSVVSAISSSHDDSSKNGISSRGSGLCLRLDGKNLLDANDSLHTKKISAAMELTRSGLSPCTTLFLSLLLLVTHLPNCTCSRTRSMQFHNHGNHVVDDDPSIHVFFNLGDLEIGNNMSVYFSRPNAKASPPLLTRGEAETMPFSSSGLPKLLELFSLSSASPQAKAMDYTLKQCELETIRGETKSCATSLEAMLDFARGVLGDGHVKVLTTTLPVNSTGPLLQNYVVLEVREVRSRKIIGCHTMPFPYLVYYCHAQESCNKLFEVSLGGAGGDRVEAVGVCHMDTSKWDRDHVSFRVLAIEPGSRPVCHFFPVDNLVWVAPASGRVVA